MEKPQVNINLDNTQEIICDECGNNTFIEVMFLRKVSKFLTGGKEDGIVPLPTFQCSVCHHVNEGFLPKNL